MAAKTKDLTGLGGDYVQSLARGLEVIRAFAGHTGTLTLTQVAHITGMSRAAARRFLLTLNELGYMATDGKTFRLTPKVLELGYSYLSNAPLPQIISPHIQDLAAKVHLPTSAAVLDGPNVLYISRASGTRLLQLDITIGKKLPASTSSLGRALLSGLSDDRLKQFFETNKTKRLTPLTKTSTDDLLSAVRIGRTDGYWVMDQEMEIGMRSLAVPIRDKDGAVVAAINISHGAGNSVELMLEDLLEPLLQTKASIEEDLKGLEFSL